MVVSKKACMRMRKKQQYQATREKILAVKKANAAAANRHTKNQAERNADSRARYSANSEAKKHASRSRY